jgi:hypothetical protein
MKNKKQSGPDLALCCSGGRRARARELRGAGGMPVRGGALPPVRGGRSGTLLLRPPALGPGAELRCSGARQSIPVSCCFGMRRTRPVEAAGRHGRAGDGCARPPPRDEGERGGGAAGSKGRRRRGRELDEGVGGVCRSGLAGLVGRPCGRDF